MNQKEKSTYLWKGVLILIMILLFVNILMVKGPKKSLTPSFNALPTSGGTAVAVINVKGAISGETSEPIFKSLEAIAQNPSIKGIMININSPGGTTGTSEEIYNELMTLRAKGIKIVSSIGDLGASGGYYIASASDLIVANASSLTGSIGVIMSTMNVKTLTDKLGIKVVNLTSGNMKDMLSPFKDMSAQDAAYVKSMIGQIYDQFVNDVLKGRGKKITKEKLISVADGRVLTGMDAKNVGLIDMIGGYTTAQEEMKKLLNSTKLRYITFSGSYFENMLKMLGVGKASFSQEMSIQAISQNFLKNNVNTPLYFSPLGGVY